MEASRTERLLLILNGLLHDSLTTDEILHRQERIIFSELVLWDFFHIINLQYIKITLK